MTNITQPGMELENKGAFGVTHIFKAKQGNRTAGTQYNGMGKTKGVTYASPIQKGDWVKLSGDEEVVKCSAGDNTAIGIAMDDFYHVGAIPTTSANWGSYDNNCYVKVETFGRKIKTVQLEAANSAVSVGNYIKVGTTTYNRFDKDSNATNAIALEAATASSGARIKVLFGFIPLK